MIRKLMASSALALLMSAGAYNGAQAQDTAPAQPAIVDDQATTTQVAPSEDTLQPDQPTLATAFMGRTVYSSDAPDSENIGEVNDLIVSDDGSITHAVVGVGGFLGIGEKDVAVPFDELQVVEREGEVSLIYAATREQLEAAPALDRTAYDPAQRFSSEQAATETAMAPAAGTDTMAPADQGAMAPAATDQSAMSGDVAAPAPADSGDMVAQTDATTAAPVPADMNFVAFNEDQLRSSDLMGANVYGPDDQSIGSISDLVLNAEGTARSALIDVGGFLGLGARTVAIPVGDLTITAEQNNAAAMPADGTGTGVVATDQTTTADTGGVVVTDQTTTADAGAAPMAGEGTQTAVTADATTMEPATLSDGDVRVTVAMTREQLEQLPEYVAPNEAVDAADAGAMGTADQPDATVPADQTAATLPADSGTAAPATGMAEPATTGSIGTEYSRAAEQLAATELSGATVYGPDDSTVGEIGDLVLDRNGDIQAAIIDVGGFLGMGEKPVAVDLANLNVRRDENGTLMVMIDATTEQLTNAPTYEEAPAAQ